MLRLFISIVLLILLLGCQSSGSIRRASDLQPTAYTKDPALLASESSYTGAMTLLVSQANNRQTEEILRSIISSSELSLLSDTQGDRPLKVVGAYATPFFDVTTRPLGRGCADVQKLRDQWNRETDAGLGPIEVKQSYWARLLPERQTYYSVVPNNNMEFIESVSLQGNRIKVQTAGAYLLEERVGPVRQIVQVDEYPPARGAIGAGMTTLFMPLIAALPEEERREYMMDLGCVSETLLGFDVSPDLSTATGKYAVGIAPASNLINLEISNSAQYAITSDSTGYGEVALDYSYISDLFESTGVSLVEVSFECIDCSIAGRFNELKDSTSRLIALNDIKNVDNRYFADLSQAKRIAFNDEIRSMFEPQLTDRQLQILLELDIMSKEEIRALQSEMGSQGYAQLLGHNAKSFFALRSFVGDMNEAEARNLSAYEILARRLESEVRAAERRQEVLELSEWYEVYIVFQDTCVANNALRGSVRRRLDAMSKEFGGGFSDTEKQEAWDLAKKNYKENDIWEMASFAVTFGGLDPNFDPRDYCTEWVSQTLDFYDFLITPEPESTISEKPP